MIGTANIRIAHGSTTVFSSLAIAASLSAAPRQDPPPPVRRVPIVMVAGCAQKTAQPHVWRLTDVGARHESTRAGIARDEEDRLATAPLGKEVYLLVGVAEFVDAETSRMIGVRGQILAPARVNSTGMLVTGHHVVVKGLFIDGDPGRINLTSVVDLGRSCP